MKRLRLIHWNAAEAAPLAERLRAAGYEVDASPFTGPESQKKLRTDPMDVIVIDLSRLPSQGRDVALAVRFFKPSRFTPIVFAGGSEEKVALIRQKVPQAVYTTWDQIESALAWAVEHPPSEVDVPASLLSGYADAPLAKKLGIQAGMQVALMGAPSGFEASLVDLPSGVALSRSLAPLPDLTLWFVHHRADLESGLPQVTSLAENGGLWILWPKKASGVETDLTQPVVRQAGLAAGLVDYRVCSVDATWTGLRFTRRSPKA